MSVCVYIYINTICLKFFKRILISWGILNLECFMNYFMEMKVTMNKSIMSAWTCSFGKPYYKSEINPLQFSTFNKL